MAIVAYYGKPRNGKSYSVVANVILPALDGGRVVYTNIPLNGKYLDNPNYHTFDNKVKAEYFAGLPAGSVIVIDEAWRYFPAGQRVSVISDEVKEFLAMHGHNVDEAGNTTQIVIVSQAPNQLGSFIKGLVQEAYSVSKKGEKQFRTDQYSGESAENLKGSPDSKFFTKFNQEVFDHYKTATNSSTGNAGNEKKIDKRGGILNSWLIKFGLPMSLLLLIAGGYYTYQFISGFGKTEIESPGQKTDIPKVENGKPLVDVVQVEHAQPSKVWRVQGWDQIRKGGPVRVFIVHSSGAVYPISSKLCTAFFNTWQCEYDNQIITPHTGEPERTEGITDIASSFLPVGVADNQYHGE